MTKSSIPPFDKVLEGIELVLENSQRLIRSGDNITELGEYGLARSLFVLAAEEAIKAFVLILMSLSIELPHKPIHSIMTQHKPRQFIAGYWILIDFLLSRWLNLISTLNDEHADTSSQGYIDARKLGVKNLVDELNRMADASPGESAIIDVMDWWKDSNDYKQQGLYVDFNGDHWRTPADVKEADFLTARNIALDAVNNSRDLSERLLSLSTEEKDDLSIKFSQAMADLKSSRLDVGD